MRVRRLCAWMVELSLGIVLLFDCICFCSMCMCTWVHSYGGQKKYPYCVPLVTNLHLFPLKHNLSLNLELNILARLSGKQASRTHLSPSSQCWSDRHTNSLFTFMWVLGIKTPSSMHVQQAFLLTKSSLQDTISFYLCILYQGKRWISCKKH